MKVSKGLRGDIVDLPSHSHAFRQQLCVTVTGFGVVSLVAARPPGPFLVPSIPFLGRLYRCDTCRVWVKNGTDVTVTVAAEDAEPLTLSAALGGTQEAATVDLAFDVQYTSDIESATFSD